MITSLNLNLSVANFACNFSKLDKCYFIKLLTQDKNGHHSDLFKFFVLSDYLIELIYELEFIYNSIKYFGSIIELIHWNIIYHYWFNSKA